MAEERPVDLDDASGRGDDAGSRDVPDRGVPDEDRAVGGLGVATRTVGVLDPEVDAHVHSGFSAGHDSIGAIVCAAQLAGLRQVTFGDQVDAQAAWLPAYREAVLRAQRRTDLELRISAEVEVVRPDGWLAFPADLGGLDAVTVAVSRLPLGGRLAEAAEARAMLAAGRLRPADVIEMVVSATVLGVERASRYAPTQLARPLGLLAELGVDEDEVPEPLLRECVEGCRVTNTTVEVSEAWRRPSLRFARMCATAGVTLAAASDARYANEVGRWRYVHQLSLAVGGKSPQLSS